MSNHKNEIDAVYNKKVIGLLNQVVQRTALSIDRDLVLETPVGNPDLWQNPEAAPEGYTGGRARANWLASINTSETTERDRTERDESDSVQSQLSFYGAGDTIYITNNLPYVKRLNEGWSTQAPSGFIDNIVRRNIEKVKEVTRILEGRFNA